MYGFIRIMLMFSIIPLIIAHGLTPEMEVNMFVIWSFLFVPSLGFTLFFYHFSFFFHIHYFKLVSHLLGCVRLEKNGKSLH